MTTADLASRLNWLPCETCGQSGSFEILNSGFSAELCIPCNGVGWLPSPTVLEAIAKALVKAHGQDVELWDSASQFIRNAWLAEARAAWEAQARVVVEGSDRKDET